MADIVDQIFNELATISDMAEKLHGKANGAARQTDLEVAILTQQVAELREKNIRATKLIDESLSILTKLKAPAQHVPKNPGELF